MASIYDDEDTRAALTQGLLGAGLAMLGARKGQEYNAFAQAGLLGLGGYNTALRDSTRAREERAMLDMRRAQFEQQQADLQRQQQEQAKMQQAAAGAFTGGAPEMGPPTDQGEIQPAVAPQFSPQAYIDALRQQGLPQQAIAAAEKYAPKPKTLKDTRTLTHNGKRVTVNFYTDGSHELVPYAPDAEKVHFANTGNRAGVPLDPYTGNPLGGGIPMGMSPADAARIGIDRQRLGLEQQRAAREAANPTAANPPAKLTTADNKALEDARAVAAQANEIADKGLQFKAVNALQRTGSLIDRASWLPTMDKEKQLMESFTAKIAPQMRIPGSGTTSDRDLSFFVAASPSIEKPKQVNDAIVTGFDVSRRNANDRVQFLEAYAQNKGSLLGADQMWRQYLNDNPIFDPNSTPMRPALNEDRQTWQEYFGGSQRKPKAAPAPGKLPTLDELEAEARRRGLNTGGIGQRSD